MIDCPLEDEELERARDIFVFCAFTGLSYTDVKQLSVKQIQSSFNGKLWIRGKRRKSGAEYTIPLLDISGMILDKYRGKAKGDLAIPVIDLYKYNILLGKIVAFAV
jgi:integrase